MDPVPFVVALFVSSILHLVAVEVFPSMGLLDFPERYGLARARLPYPMGIVFSVLAVIAIAWIGSPLQVPAHVLAVSLAILALVCFADDRRRLPVWVRFATQIFLALWLFAEGTRIYTFQNPLSFLAGPSIISLDRVDVFVAPFGPLPFWSGVVTVAWLLLTTNAMNWFDGIPGQVNVLSVIAFLTLGLLALSPSVHQPDVGIFCFILAGLAAGGMIFSFPYTKGILGDTGAMTMGLLIGMLAMAAGGKVATAFLVLGVPLIDSVIVIVRRLLKGTSPWKGNARDEHLHHRLLQRGWSERRVVVFTAALGMAFGSSALFLHAMGKLMALALLTTLMIAVSAYARPKSV